nr:MAG TPA: hypothetical protein [Caudoviricetes sp.]
MESVVFWSGHGVDETAGSKRLGTAFGVRTIDRAARGSCPGGPSHTGVCSYGCVGYAIVGYVTVGYVLPILGYVPYLSLDGSTFVIVYSV